MPTLDPTPTSLASPEPLANRIVDAFVKHNLQPCTGAFVAEDGAWGCAVTALLLDAGVQPDDVSLHEQTFNMGVWAADILGLPRSFLNGLISGFDGHESLCQSSSCECGHLLQPDDFRAGVLTGERVLAELQARGLSVLPLMGTPVPTVLDETTVAYG